MSRALPKYNKRRVGLIGGAAAVVLSGAVIAGTALAGQDSSDGNTTANAQTLAASPGTVSCPDVASQLPANIPASAQAEVTRNLQLLQTQINEANERIVKTVGQGGPNFVQNAIVGPLKDKRVATINRIATAIGRQGVKPVGLDALAPCSVSNAGTNAGGNAGNANAGNNNAGNNNAGKNNNAGNAGNNNAGNAGNAAGAGKVSCPDVASQLPANIPASAQAEVTRNLQLLQTQINEANDRIVKTVGQGGPNFVQNAIVGPLKDKRVATINRIATAIGRQGVKPVGLDALAACTVNK